MFKCRDAKAYFGGQPVTHSVQTKEHGSAHVTYAKRAVRELIDLL